MAVNYVGDDKSKAVLFAYDVHPRYYEKLMPVKLQGLDPHRSYKIEEINLMPGKESSLEVNGKVFTGDFLMKVGIDVFSFSQMQSHVLELTAM